MIREEISSWIGNISDEYIQEAAEYSVPYRKKHVLKHLFEFVGIRPPAWKKNKLWMKRGIVAVCFLLFAGGTVSLIMNKTVENEKNETAYKPAIMYDGNLYLLSIHKPDVFEVDKSELQRVGSIQQTLSGRELPTEDFQASGKNLLGCDMYTTDSYPECIFIFDHNGHMWVYESDNE